MQAIIAQAMARGLSVNDYLQTALGLGNGSGRVVPQPALSEESLRAADERLFAFSGAVNSGDPAACDNVRLDADLARGKESTEPQSCPAVQPARNEAMFAVLQRSAQRRKNMPVSGSTAATLKIIREGRAGAMYGYEPTDTE